MSKRVLLCDQIKQIRENSKKTFKSVSNKRKSSQLTVRRSKSIESALSIDSSAEMASKIKIESIEDKIDAKSKASAPQQLLTEAIANGKMVKSFSSSTTSSSDSDNAVVACLNNHLVSRNLINTGNGNGKRWGGGGDEELDSGLCSAAEEHSHDYFKMSSTNAKAFSSATKSPKEDKHEACEAARKQQTKSNKSNSHRTEYLKRFNKTSSLYRKHPAAPVPHSQEYIQDQLNIKSLSHLNTVAPSDWKSFIASHKSNFLSLKPFLKEKDKEKPKALKNGNTSKYSNYKEEASPRHIKISNSSGGGSGRGTHVDE
jgi:hypothetical protein